MNGIPVPSGSSSLKRKHLSTKDHEPPPAKKLKKSKRAGEALEVIKQYKPSSKEKVKDKGKGKDHASGLEFKSVNARMTVTIPPLYSGPGRPRQAVLEMLDGMLMRYIPNLQGVLLAHSNLEFLSTSAVFLIDSPFAKVDIAFTALVWSPAVGSTLWGTISICSPDHIGLLVHKTFNASIPRHHIPTDDWEFVYGSKQSPEGIAEEEEERGNWVHKVTKDDIGGPTSQLQFTITGLSLSHGMLSLLGSLQDDPFSPEHVPRPAVSPTKARQHGKQASRSDAEEDSVVEALGLDPSGEEAPAEFASPEDDNDPPIHEAFAALGAETDLLYEEVANKKKRKEGKKAKRAAEEDTEIEKPKKKKKLKT